MIDRSRPVNGDLEQSTRGRRGEIGGADERQHDRLAPEQCDEDGEREPDEAVVPEMRERDEDRVERLGAVVDDPPLDTLIERDHEAGGAALPR